MFPLASSTLTTMATPEAADVCPADVLVYDLQNYPSESLSSFFYTSGEKILITVIMPIIWAIGLPVNVAFIYVVIRLRRMRTVTNYYLLNLAIADIMFLCFAEGDKIGRYIASPVWNDQYGLKPVGCVLINYIVQLSYYASIFLVTLVTLEKYYAVCRPVLHRLVTGRKRTISMVTGAWVLAGVFAAGLIPAWVAWTSYCILWPDKEEYANVPNLVGYCLPVSPVMQTVVNGLQTVPFFIVMTANFVMYALIIRAVNTRVAVREQQQGAAAVRSIQMRNQVVRMLIANGVIFFITLAPYQCASLAMMISSAIGKYVLDDDQVTKVQWAGRILSYINSAINPFVYTFVNPRYRQAFMEAFACCPSVKERLMKKSKLEDGGSSIGMDQTANNNGRTVGNPKQTSTTDA